MLFRDILRFLPLEDQSQVARVSKAWAQGVKPPVSLPIELVETCVTFLPLRDMSQTVLVSRLWGEGTLLGVGCLAEPIAIFYNFLYRKVGSATFPATVESPRYEIQELKIDFSDCQNLSEVKSMIVSLKERIIIYLSKLNIKQFKFLKESVDIKIPLSFADVFYIVEKERMLASIARLGSSELVTADARIKDDGEVILFSLAYGYRGLAHASQRLKNDKKFILEVIRVDARAVEYAGQALKNNKEVMLAVVRQDGSLFSLASVALKKDKDIVLAALQQIRDSREERMNPRLDAWLIFELADGRFKNDREFMLAAVQLDASWLTYATQELQDDKEIARVAARQINKEKEMLC
jgi:hypothetical protein